MKAHTSPTTLWGQVGNGGQDHAWWGSAEVLPMARPSYAITAACPGSDLAGETAAALAAISMVFESSDPGYAQQLLTEATELYDFAYADGNDSQRRRYSECITDAAGFYNSWSGYFDELVWSALWMHRATGNQLYLNRAEAGYADLSTEPQQTIKSYRWTHAWDDKAPWPRVRALPSASRTAASSSRPVRRRATEAHDGVNVRGDGASAPSLSS